jgi:hypothetical protein
LQEHACLCLWLCKPHARLLKSHASTFVGATRLLAELARHCIRASKLRVVDVNTIVTHQVLRT